MKVLHVLDHSIPLHSGYAFRTLAILREQAALGIQTFQLTSTKHGAVDAETEEVDGLLFHRTRASGSILEKLPVLNQYEVVRSLRKRLLQVARELNPDVLHAHSPCLNGMAALTVGRELRIPVVYEMRTCWEDAAVSRDVCREGDLRYRVSRSLETSVLRKADAITTICEGLRTEIIGRGVAPERVTVVANAVNIEDFVPRERDAALAERLGLSGGPVLGYIGSFSVYEGLQLLLDAFPTILEVHPDVRLLLVGGGHADEDLRERVRKSGLDGKVIFTGRVPHDRIQAYYSVADIMVYPRISIRLTEMVTPLKPLEAMALHRLVVASDIGGHRELVRPGDTGTLFRAGDSGSLAEEALGLLANRNDWDAMRARARTFAEKERTWKGTVEPCLPLYERLVGNASSRP